VLRLGAGGHGGCAQPKPQISQSEERRFPSDMRRMVVALVLGIAVPALGVALGGAHE
jgi:hypothetical protein